MTVAANPVDLNSGLRDAIDRARPAVQAAIDRQRGLRSPRPPLPIEVREAVERLLVNGTYARAVVEVTADDPELRDS